MNKKTIISILSALAFIIIGIFGYKIYQDSKPKIARPQELMSQNKERVWFDLRNTSDQGTQISKESEVESIIITKNGKAKIYQIDNSPRLQEFQKLNDKELINKAKKLDKERYTDAVNMSNEHVKQVESRSQKDFELVNEDAGYDNLNQMKKESKERQKKVQNTEYKAPQYQELNFSGQSAGEVLQNETISSLKARTYDLPFEHFTNGLHMESFGKLTEEWEFKEFGAFNQNETYIYGKPYAVYGKTTDPDATEPNYQLLATNISNIKQPKEGVIFDLDIPKNKAIKEAE